MNSYPDPMQKASEPLLIEEPEYREYPPTPPQPRIPPYPTAPSFSPGYPPMQAPPYPYSSAGQAVQPLPRQPMSPTPRKKTNSRGWVFLLVSIAVVILLLGGVLIYAFAQTSSSPARQSLTVDGLTATLLSVEPLQGDGMINPDPGNKFVVVHIQLHNNQNTSQVYNSFDFHVFNGNNQERDVEFIAPTTYTGDHQLSEDDLAPNDTVTGDLIIQVPINDHHVKLGWNPGNVAPSDSTYEWNLGL